MHIPNLRLSYPRIDRTRTITHSDSKKVNAHPFVHIATTQRTQSNTYYFNAVPVE